MAAKHPTKRPAKRVVRRKSRRKRKAGTSGKPVSKHLDTQQTQKLQAKRDRAADLRLRRTYGITLAEYHRIFEHQGLRCAICKRPVSVGKVRLAVDHCHTTGLLRGLCCWVCNRSIAVFRDDITRLQAAVDYLSQPPISTVFGEHRYTAPGRVGSRKRAKLLLALVQSSQSPRKSGKSCGKSKTGDV